MPKEPFTPSLKIVTTFSLTKPNSLSVMESFLRLSFVASIPQMMTSGKRLLTTC